MFSRFRFQLNQWLVVSTVAVISGVAIAALQMPHLKQLTAPSKTAPIEALTKQVEAETLRLALIQKLPSFGFDNLMANWVLLNFFQYFGDDLARQQTNYALAPAYFETIVNRDPRFLAAYVPLYTSISLYAGMPEQSVALMEKGLKSMSPKIPAKSYYVWRYKATDELLFLEDIKSAQQSFEMAGKWASTYSDSESQAIAAISLRTAQFLAGNPDKKRIRTAQESAWASVLVNALNTNDERTSQRIIRAIETRGGKVTITTKGEVNVQLP